MDTETNEPAAGVCCGEKAGGKAGAPFVNACMLCPKSPTYYRDEPAMAARLATNDLALSEAYRRA